MGQRHQIYVIIKNPLKRETLGGDIWNEKDKKNAELYFGNKSYSVLPFHNQWLYGATAVSLMSSIMNEVLRAKGTLHPFSPDFNGTLPYKNNYDKYPGYGLIEMVENFINYQSNIELAEIAGRFGFEKGFYIGDESYDYEKKKGIMNCRKWQFDFTGGDNNDGITIIDTIKQKYCFINIFNEQDKSCNDVCALQPMKPVSWLEYLKAYYPNKKDTHKEFEKHLSYLNDKVLTLKEVINYFPNSYVNYTHEKLEL
jgi:hypothetical protein